MSLPSNRVRHHGSTAPPPSVAPAKNHLGEMDHPRLLCATEQVARSALPSRFRACVQGREVEMTVQCQNRANCAGVYRCQIRTYDEKMVNDRPSRLFSAQQEALQSSLGWNWLFGLTVAEFGCRDAGRSMKCHPLEGVRRSLTPSFALRSGSTARTVGYSPGPCPRTPRSARSTTSAISEDWASTSTVW